jgi:general secretion pathway protein D
MKHRLFLILMLFCVFTANAQSLKYAVSLPDSAVKSLKQKARQPAVQTQQAKFDFQSVSISQVIQLIYSEALKTHYVLEPEVLLDMRLVSFRYGGDKVNLKAFLTTFLEPLGYAVNTREGIDFVVKVKVDMQTPPPPIIDEEILVYRPRFRDVAYLSRVMAPLLKGSFSVNRAIAAPLAARVDRPVLEGSPASLIDQNADTLVFTGTAAEVKKLNNLLPQIDYPVGEVMVRGVVYEVTSNDKEGSAFGLLANVLGGKLSIGLGTLNAIGNFARLKNASLDAIYSALSQDSRFKVVSSPSLRIRSGSNGTFSVGQDVPVLGAVSYPSNGNAVQSVEYRSSGVLFNIMPTVREGVIDLNIDQQLSNFIATTTGVNNSPTLIKRALKTSVGLQDGDLIVLGGLTEDKETASRDGFSFLPKFLRSRGTENSKTEILLVLQVQRI